MKGWVTVLHGPVSPVRARINIQLKLLAYINIDMTIMFFTRTKLVGN